MLTGACSRVSWDEDICRIDFHTVVDDFIEKLKANTLHVSVPEWFTKCSFRSSSSR